MLIPHLLRDRISALCIIGTYHKPHPHDIKIGVVGPAVTDGTPARGSLRSKRAQPLESIQVTQRRRPPNRRSPSVTSTQPLCPRRIRTNPATVIVAPSAGGRIVATAAENLAALGSQPPGCTACRARCPSTGTPGNEPGSVSSCSRSCARCVAISPPPCSSPSPPRFNPRRRYPIIVSHLGAHPDNRLPRRRPRVQHLHGLARGRSWRSSESAPSTRL